MLKKYFLFLLSPEVSPKDKLCFVLNLLIPLLTGAYIFICPLPLVSLNEICYYISVAALITLLIFRKTNFTLRTPLTLPFVLFTIWALFGLFFALDLQNSLHDLRSHLLKYLVIFYLLVNFFSTRKRLEILSWLLIAGATVFAIGGSIGFYVLEGYPLSARMGITFKEMHTGFIGYTTTLAALLSIYHFHRHKPVAYKLLFAFCFLANLAVTILTQTRSSLMGLIVGLLILCFAEKKNIALVLVLAALVVFMPGMKTRIETQGFTQDIRSQMYRLTWEVIKDYPITGIGFGIATYGNNNVLSLEKYNNRLPPEYQQHDTYQGKEVIVASTHSTILDIAVRMGLVGLMFFFCILLTAVGMLGLIFKRHRKDEYFHSWTVYLFAGLISYFIPSIFVDTTYGPRAVIFYTILAMITILWHLALQRRPEPLKV